MTNYIRPEIAAGEMSEKQCMSLEPNHINTKEIKHATNKLDITIICAFKNPVKCSHRTCCYTVRYIFHLTRHRVPQLCMGPSYFWRGLNPPDPPLFRTLNVPVSQLLERGGKTVWWLLESS